MTNKSDVNLNDLLPDLTFRTQGYRKNYDIVNENENIVTEYEGIISKLRIPSRMMPLTIGEYSISTWDIRLGRKLNIDIRKLIKTYDDDDIYYEFSKVIDDLIDIYNYDKIVLITSLILREDHRKRGVIEEFAEMIYRDFYTDNTMVIAIVKPFQEYRINADYYYHLHSVEVMNNIRDKSITRIPALEYYSLDKFKELGDTEMNEYKLFSIANKCGFNRIGETHLFKYSPEKTIKRILEKNKL